MSRTKTLTSFYDYCSTSTGIRAFHYIRYNNLNDVRTLLCGITTPELNNIIDEYDNTLLHISVMTGKIDIIKYLLDRGMNKYQKNSFGETPWFKAIQTQNQDIIQTFIDVDTYDFLDCKKRATAYESENKTLKLLNEQMQQCNDDITAKYNSELLDNNNNKKEIVMYKAHNKRLRDENDDLIAKNKKLKTSVESLTNLVRK